MKYKRISLWQIRRELHRHGLISTHQILYFISQFGFESQIKTTVHTWNYWRKSLISLKKLLSSFFHQKTDSCWRRKFASFFFPNFDLDFFTELWFSSMNFNWNDSTDSLAMLWCYFQVRYFWFHRNFVIFRKEKLLASLDVSNLLRHFVSHLTWFDKTLRPRGQKQ